jgi:hypothetical protein
MKIIIGRSAWLLGILLAAGCAHQPGPTDITPGSEFNANILEDGTKLFVFSVPLAHPGKGGGGDIRREMGDDEDMSRARREVSHPGPQAVQAMLAQNSYCREGYLVLEQYEQQRRYVTRGECRDGATEQDRERFPKQK